MLVHKDLGLQPVSLVLNASQTMLGWYVWITERNLHHRKLLPHYISCPLVNQDTATGLLEP